MKKTNYFLNKIAINTFSFLYIIILSIPGCRMNNASSTVDDNSQPCKLRIATFNTSLNRNNSGDLINDLKSSYNKQAQSIAEIIQRVNPDIILLNEFDYDKDAKALELFKNNYLSRSFNGSKPVNYPYHFTASVNTGIDSGLDLDNDNKTNGPGDAFGYGVFPGQYGMVILSKYPIIQNEVRTFQKFLWKDMPGANLPKYVNGEKSGEHYYSEEELEILRLSSKSHWDIPVQIDECIIHVLASHPTPPVFDGAEDRNGRRNHDEIRFWADYIDYTKRSYIYDDNGCNAGLLSDDHFVILGDFNADPFDGDSFNNAINQLLEHKMINTSITPSSKGAVEASQNQGGMNKNHKGNASYDTGDFNDRNPGNLRLDYVLPDIHTKIIKSGVFWPAQNEAHNNLTGVSDHRLVWIDISF